MPRRVGRPARVGNPTKAMSRSRRYERNNPNRHKQKKLISDSAQQLIEQGIIKMPVKPQADVKPEAPAAEAPVLAVGADARAVVEVKPEAITPAVADEVKMILEETIKILRSFKEVPGFALVPSSLVGVNPTVEKEIMKLEDGMSLVKLKAAAEPTVEA